MKRTLIRMLDKLSNHKKSIKSAPVMKSECVSDIAARIFLVILCSMLLSHWHYMKITYKIPGTVYGALSIDVYGIQ